MPFLLIKPGSIQWSRTPHKAMGEDFMRAQLATYERVVPDMDVIITTAMIPNRTAPELITAEMVVARDLSGAERGGGLASDRSVRSDALCYVRSVFLLLVVRPGAPFVASLLLIAFASEDGRSFRFSDL